MANTNDIEMPALRNDPDPRVIKLQLLLKLFLHFDLCACHSILERLPADQWRQNIADHFSRLWFTPPPVEIIERWLHSDELYHSHELIHDKDFNGYVQRLYNDGLLRKALTRETSALYYSRFILYRIWMLRERRDVHHVAMRDISRALEMNLGVMAGDPQPENEGALVGFLNHQMVMPQVRMSRTLIEARHLRDQITEAFNLGELDADLLPSLRQRMRSLDEHYPEAFRLLEEDAGQLAQLLDKDREVWLTRDQPTPVPSATDGLAVLLTVLASFITLLASIPAWRSYQLTPTGPGPREDANFYNLLASAVLQVLGLAVQMFGPLGWPSLFRRAAVATGDTAVVVWVFVALTLICTIASIPIFLWLSAQWSGMIAFAGQSILGLVQLLLVFG